MLCLPIKAILSQKSSFKMGALFGERPGFSTNSLGEEVVQPSEDSTADYTADKTPDQSDQAAERRDGVSKVEAINEYGSA